VNVHTGAQFAPDFMQLNPNAKVPVLRDDETGVVTAESNAILLYLAEKTGRLMPKGPVGRAKLVELLFFQAACVGPMFGQRAHFALFAPEHVDYAIVRYDAEGDRLYGVIEAYLGDKDWLVDDYSIADIAVFAWVNTAISMGFGVTAYPALSAWVERMRARPAVARGITIPDHLPAFGGRRYPAADPKAA
jgi:GSH-dependent disulfide-bond oxidoreductase